MPTCLYVDDVASLQVRGEVVCSVDVDVDTAWAAEFCYFYAGAVLVAAARVVGAMEVDGRIQLRGALAQEYPPPVEGGGSVRRHADHPLFARDDVGTAEFLAMRRHWDERYARPGRVSLSEPHREFADWVARVSPLESVVLLGDGEGRNVQAVPHEAAVVVVEASAMAVEVASVVPHPGLEVVCADMIRWMLADDLRWSAIGILYVGPFSEREFSVLLAYLERQRRRGSQVFIELGAVVLDAARLAALAAVLDVTPVVFRRDAGDVERVQFATG